MDAATHAGAVDVDEDLLVLTGALAQVGVEVHEPDPAGWAEQMRPGAVETKAARAPDRSASHGCVRTGAQVPTHVSAASRAQMPAPICGSGFNRVRCCRAAAGSRGREPAGRPRAIRLRPLGCQAR